MILGDELGIGHDPSQHAAYVGSWIRALKDDPMEVFRAAADAEKIQNYVLGFEQKQVQDQSVQQSHADELIPEANVQLQENSQGVPMQSMPGKMILYNNQPGRRGVEVWDEDGSHVAFGGKVAIARFAQENKLSPEDVQTLNELDSRKYSSPAPEVGLNAIDRVDKQQQHTRSLEQEDKMQTNNYQAELARGNQEQVIYLVGSPSGTSTEYTDVLEAAQAFHDTNAEQRPFVIRSENRVGGGDAAVSIASTSMVEHGGVKEYGKGVGDADPAFKVAYDGISGQTQKPEKTYINVPFKEKEEAKALGAKWDRQEKSWYVPIGVDLAPFAKWEKPAATAETDEPKVATSTESQVENQKPAQERQYLAVPYGERAAAKVSGAIWDKSAKSWYVGPDGNMDKLERWKPDNLYSECSSFRFLIWLKM